MFPHIVLCFYACPMWVCEFMVNTKHVKCNNNNSTVVGTKYIVMCTYPFITRFSTFYLCFQAEAVAGAAVWWWVARVATNPLWISSFWTCWTGRGTRNAWNAPTVTARCPTNATAGMARYCASPTFTGEKSFPHCGYTFIKHLNSQPFDIAYYILRIFSQSIHNVSYY